MTTKKRKRKALLRGNPADLTPGRDFAEPPKGYKGPVRFLNWGGYKIATYDEGGLKANFFDEVAARRRDNRSVIILVVGDPGEGKSYLALRFCQIFDKRFTVLDVDDPRVADPSTDPSQIVFEREHLLYLIGRNSPLKYGQCILADEAQYAMGSRRWYEQIQKDLMESIESVRSKGYIIVIVALHLELLDKIVRKHVLTYLFKMQERGTAIVYRLFTPTFGTDLWKRRLGILSLKMPGAEECESPDCLRCKYSHLHPDTPPTVPKCMNIRAIYERRKKAFVDMRSELARLKSMASKQPKRKRVPVKELAEYVKDNLDKIKRDNKGRLDPVSIQLLVEKEFDTELSLSRAKEVRLRLEHMDPSLVPSPEEVKRRKRLKKYLEEDEDEDLIPIGIRRRINALRKKRIPIPIPEEALKERDGTSAT